MLEQSENQPIEEVGVRLLSLNGGYLLICNMRVGHTRVSTDDQKLHTQRDALTRSGLRGLSVLMNDEQKADVVANVPIGRIGTPDDMGKRRYSLPPTTAVTSTVLSCSLMVVSLNTNQPQQLTLNYNEQRLY